MALGGGTFLVQNKKLPGAYINFVSAATASATLSDRGIATMPLILDWGIDGEIFEVTNGDFQKNSQEIFGYAYTHPKLKGLRDLFKNLKTLYAYKLTSGGTKANNNFAEATYTGERGNDLKIVVQVNTDDISLFDVKTLLDMVVVDEQTVANISELVDNSFVKWKKGSVLRATAATPLTGGTNGTVDGAAHQAYLDKIESYVYNTMGVAITDEVTKSLYIAFNKRLRDEMGIKFQLVLFGCKKPDYYGVINIKNSIIEPDEFWNEASLVYWVTGVQAGCAVNKSVQNRIYDGEFQVHTDFKQTELEQAIQAGEFTFHKVGTEIRVLEDVNSMVTTTEELGEVFKDNQTVRVIDQIGNDIAVLFNTKYLGIVSNNKSGRTSFWADIVAYYRQLEQISAIEEFNEKEVIVEQGATKKSVVVSGYITVVNTMSKLYMVCTIG